MTRSAYQVLVIPYRQIDYKKQIEFAILKRSDEDYWQFIAGGGEQGETPIQAAFRESVEEAGIDPDSTLVSLESSCTMPVDSVCGRLWGNEILVIPEYSFAVHLHESTLTLSNEHTSYEWRSYDDASKMLRWDSNRSALWELNEKINGGSI